MVKSREDSVIEIWGTKYINRDVNRLQEDIFATIIQCEPGNTSGDYIVEVVRKEHPDHELEKTLPLRTHATWEKTGCSKKLLQLRTLLVLWRWRSCL